MAGDFDLVYTTLGVLCWLPDVGAWARVAARLLRPGGRLVLRDDHPVFMAVGDDASHGLTLHEPYFQQDEPMTWQDEGSCLPPPFIKTLAPHFLCFRLKAQLNYLALD